MQTRSVLSVLFLCGVLAPTPNAWATCDGTPASSGARAIEVAGVMRHFVVRLPAAYDGRLAAPVVFAFHPFGMNANYMQSRVPIARAWPEAIVVYPEGSATANRQPGWQTATAEKSQGQVNTDVQFFDAMLAWVGTHACVDAKRVFVMGYSNGAQFANLLACERSEAIAGAAVASGRLPCRPAVSKPVVISHGLNDRTIGYDQAVTASQVWAARNGCSAPPKAGVLGCVAAEACSSSATTLCTYAGGHEYNPPFTRTVVDFFKVVAQP